MAKNSFERLEKIEKLNQEISSNNSQILKLEKEVENLKRNLHETERKNQEFLLNQQSKRPSFNYPSDEENN